MKWSRCAIFGGWCAGEPLGTEIERVRSAIDAVREAGVVCQVGAQIRSLPSIVGCREVVKSGILGKITRVEEVRTAKRPYWYFHLKDAREEDVDWKEFLMDREMRPFRSDIYSGWYGDYESLQRASVGAGHHFIDLVLFMSSAGCPEACVCPGGTFGKTSAGSPRRTGARRYRSIPMGSSSAM